MSARRVMEGGVNKDRDATSEGTPGWREVRRRRERTSLFLPRLRLACRLGGTGWHRNSFHVARKWQDGMNERTENCEGHKLRYDASFGEEMKGDERAYICVRNKKQMLKDVVHIMFDFHLRRSIFHFRYTRAHAPESRLVELSNLSNTQTHTRSFMMRTCNSRYVYIHVKTLTLRQ